MGYTIDSIDELDETRMRAELARREDARRQGVCDYCGVDANSQPCRFPERHEASRRPSAKIRSASPW